MLILYVILVCYKPQTCIFSVTKVVLSSPFLNYILVKVYISVVNIGNARLRGCATRPHYQLSHNIIQAKQVAVKEKRAGFGEDF